jgi:hypothetical protein
MFWGGGNAKSPAGGDLVLHSTIDPVSSLLLEADDTEAVPERIAVKSNRGIAWHAMHLSDFVPAPSVLSSVAPKSST